LRVIRTRNQCCHAEFPLCYFRRCEIIENLSTGLSVNIYIIYWLTNQYLEGDLHYRHNVFHFTSYSFLCLSVNVLHIFRTSFRF
jgi:hypothetical protein